MEVRWLRWRYVVRAAKRSGPESRFSPLAAVHEIVAVVPRRAVVQMRHQKAMHVRRAEDRGRIHDAV